MSAKNRFSIGTPLGVAIALLVVLAAGAAFASTGVGSLVTQGDDGTVTARGAQEILADNSTTRAAPVTPEEGSGDVVTLGDRAAGNPSSQNGAVASPGGGGSSLPFTGFLAIPVLLVGAALLVSGLVTRLGSRRTAASS